MGIKKELFKAAAEIIMPEAIEIGMKLGNEIYEQQKALVKIPDLKDVLLDEVMQILKEELRLTPTIAIARPNISYAEGRVNEVVLTEPRFGTKVKPGTAIKIYYLTNEVIEKSKQMLSSVIYEFKVPKITGLNIYEARTELETLGLRIYEKLEQPDIHFVRYEVGQVTRLTSPNGVKIGSKLKTGDRVLVYYVNEEIIIESQKLLLEKEIEKKEMIEKIGKVTSDVAKGIGDNTKAVTKTISEKVGRNFRSKEKKSEEK
jgi:hypothetical protein